MAINPNDDIDAFLTETRQPQRAVIREQECIGCVKCIRACPFDSILGASKQMHTVIEDACTGCELCVPACPVDCIDLVTTAALNPAQQQQKNTQWRERFEQHQARLKREKQDTARDIEPLAVRQQKIAEILKRTKK